MVTVGWTREAHLWGKKCFQGFCSPWPRTRQGFEAVGRGNKKGINPSLFISAVSSVAGSRIGSKTNIFQLANLFTSNSRVSQFPSLLNWEGSRFLNALAPVTAQSPCRKRAERSSSGICWTCVVPNSGDCSWGSTAACLQSPSQQIQKAG